MDGGGDEKGRYVAGNKRTVENTMYKAQPNRIIISEPGIIFYPYLLKK